MKKSIFTYEMFVKEKSVVATVMKSNKGLIKATKEFKFTNLLTLFSKKYKQTKLEEAKKQAIAWAENKIKELEK